MLDHKIEYIIALAQEVACSNKKLVQAEDNLKSKRWLAALPKVSSTTGDNNTVYAEHSQAHERYINAVRHLIEYAEKWNDAPPPNYS